MMIKFKEHQIHFQVETTLIMDLCHHYDPKNSYTAMTIVRDTYGFKNSGG